MKHDHLEELADVRDVGAALLAGQRIAALAGDPKRAVDGGIPYAVVADGTHLESLEPYLRRTPERLKASPKFDDFSSFVRYVNRFKADGTLIFADQKAGTLVAVIDYHVPCEQPSWCEHRATLDLKKSPEWEAWASKNSTLTKTNLFEQVALGEFLEDQMPYIIEPQGAAIQEAILKLEVQRTITVKSHHNLDNGTAQIIYLDSETQQQEQMKIPTRFKLRLRHYLGQDPIDVNVRLRYRPRDTSIVFFYLIEDFEKIAEDAFSAVIGSVAEATVRTVCCGTP